MRVRLPNLAALVWPVVGVALLAKQVFTSAAIYPGAPVTIGAAAASASLILLLLAVAVRFEGRGQTIALLAIDLVVTAIDQGQLLYTRQFSELASIAALGYASQAVRVGGAVVALARPLDALLWLDVVALAAVAGTGLRPPARSRLASTSLAVAGALLVVPPALPLVRRPLTGPRRLAVSRAEVAASLGVLGFQVVDALTVLERRVGRARTRSLSDAFAYHRARARPSGPLRGTARGRNVVVVHMESIQGFAVGRRLGGEPVTPVLDRLAKESLAFTRAYTQVGQGTSADAELLTACSLYPLETGAVFTDRYDARFRCLPEILRDAGYRTVAMHANWPNFWNRERMYPGMGYERFLSIRDFDRTPAVGLGLSDARFLEQAVDRLAAMPQPFYATLVTLSNHAPYDDPRIPRTLPLGSLASTHVGKYLDSVHLADAALGVLVERLRAVGLLDRSVLVLYGDHGGVSRTASGTELLDLPQRPDRWLQHETRVPILVRLPEGAAAGPREEPAGEVDVAPTIADLLGLPFEGTFFHGRSLVSEPPRPVVFPEGSALTEELVYLGPERRWGEPGCLDARSGRRVEPERCDALAEHAARELEVSRAEVEEDLLRWMAPPRDDAAYRALTWPGDAPHRRDN